MPSGKGFTTEGTEWGESRRPSVRRLWHSPRGSCWARAWARPNEGPHAKREPVGAAGLLHRSGLRWYGLPSGRVHHQDSQFKAIVFYVTASLLRAHGCLLVRRAHNATNAGFCTSVGYCPIHDVKDRTGGKRFSMDANIIRTYASSVKRRSSISARKCSAAIGGSNADRRFVRVRFGTDCVAKVFCRLYRAALIRRRVPQRNFDSLHPRF
jgi:hypothetical protein